MLLLFVRSKDVLRWANRSDTPPGPRKMAGNDIGMGPAAAGLIAGGKLSAAIAFTGLVVIGIVVSIVLCVKPGIYRSRGTLRVRDGQRRAAEGPRKAQYVAYVNN